MSNAGEIKQLYKELLADGEEHSRAELLQYVRTKKPKAKYTEAMLTGGLKTLTNPGSGYRCVRRAVYQKIGFAGQKKGYAQDLIDQYICMLDESLQNMNRSIVADPFKLLDLTEREKGKLKQIEQCIELMKNVVENREES